jgi:Flp pilus assembly protein TadD
MLNKLLVLAGVVALTAPVVLQGQEIHITIPRRSELTPVQKLNREGVDEVVKHKYEKAEALFFKAYLYDPSDPFTLNNLGYVSELQGQVDRAADYYRLAVEQGCDAVIDRSSDKKLKGKPMMDALGTIQNMPMRINRINTYAISLISQNRGFEAEAVLKQLLPLDPNNPFTLNNLAVAEESTGDLEDALKDYDAAAATHSMRPVVVSLKRSSRGKPISTIAANSAAELRAKMATMDIQQIRADMYAVRGVSALNKNDLPSARKNFEQAYAADPQSAFALNNYGYLAERDGDLETAMSYYARARRAADADDPVGMASQAGAEGQHLADVASESHRAVGEELAAQGHAPQGTDEGPVELLRRDGSVEPPPINPDEPSTPTGTGQPAPTATPAPVVRSAPDAQPPASPTPAPIVRTAPPAQ